MQGSSANLDLISIVVPCHNEAEVLPLLCAELDKLETTMGDQDFEYVFVDDGSTDDTWNVARSWLAGKPRGRCLSFSRNFGKEAAIFAGLEHATGDYLVLMDADMQDPPHLVTDMYRIIKQGDCDAVATRRVDRKGEPPVRSFFARRFYRLLNRSSDTEVMDGARDYRLMTRRFVDAVLSLGENNRFSKGLFSWVGFKTHWIDYENTERAAGTTKWSFWSLLKYGIGGITSFSAAPLVLASIAGSVLCLIAFIAIVFIIVRWLMFGDPVSGWPSLACIIIFIGGIQLLFQGVMGQYLASTYLETKRRPLYILADDTALEFQQEK